MINFKLIAKVMRSGVESLVLHVFSICSCAIHVDNQNCDSFSMTPLIRDSRERERERERVGQDARSAAQN
jgi:hypothetical protein